MNKHEPNTASTGWLMTSAALLVALVIFSGVSVGVLVAVLNGFHPHRSVPSTPTGAPARVEVWQHPPAQREEVERQAKERISDYAWIDRQQGIVRIPVDRAMDLMIQQAKPPESQP